VEEAKKSSGTVKVTASSPDASVLAVAISKAAGWYSRP
jgi:hypothetical protein